MDPTFPLTTALVPDPLVADAEELAFGSFFVFRKLEQNVRGFKTLEQNLADALGLTGDDRERAGAFVVGRFEDGTPITMADRPAGLESPRNDFDYTGDAAASRCPFHAHIRKTNPRGSGGFEAEPAERLHIMARRGIPYEDVPRPLHPDGLPKAESLAEFLAKVAPDLPAGGLGLLFMAYNAKIDDQFAFTQSIWANNPGFPNVPAPPPGLDGVIGQAAGNPGGQAYPKWDDASANPKPFDFKGFVTMKGGEVLLRSKPALPAQPLNPKGPTMALTQLTDSGRPFPDGDPDVQRTTFALDVLGRFVCNTYDEAVTNPAFDVVVIGSGMYGSYARPRLQRERREGRAAAGPRARGRAVPGARARTEHRRPRARQPVPAGDRPFWPDAARPRNLVWGMGWRGNIGFPGTAYCVGGKSIYWGGWCPRLRKRGPRAMARGGTDYLRGRPAVERQPAQPAGAAEPGNRLRSRRIRDGVNPADDFVFDPMLGPMEPDAQQSA